jgi:hypothetical protein
LKAERKSKYMRRKAAAQLAKALAAAQALQDDPSNRDPSAA